MTRRFDIGPFVLGLGAVLLLVALFLPWYGVGNHQDGIQPITAWEIFEITDVLLAALAVAAIVGAVGLLTPDADYVDKQWLPWISGAAFVLVVTEVLSEPSVLVDLVRRYGLWLALAGTVLMIAGTVLSLSRVSFAVAVEGRDRRRRVAAVDHRPPPTETGAPVARSSESLLHPRPEEPEAGETT